MRKNKTKELISLIIVIVQVLLLINFSVANSYIIYQPNQTTELNEKNNEKNSEFLKTSFRLLRDFLSIKQIKLVSAEEDLPELYCCPKDKDGAICQDMVSTAQDECDEDLITRPCDEVSSCEIGCCIDEEEGTGTDAPREACGDDGGEWSRGECPEKGCCIFGEEYGYVTRERCDILDQWSGVEARFEEVNSESECREIVNNLNRGACEYDGICEIKTDIECDGDGGNFNPGKLCSHASLQNNCVKQDYFACAENKEEVYWFDSCGNRENIYSGNTPGERETSWNNGMILSKENSCAFDENDPGKCGNCNYNDGYKCQMSGGNPICDNLNCEDPYKKDENGEPITRQNEESWCVYDSIIGNGTDAVGSRHWKASCFEGEIIVEGCADFRGEICAQTDLNAIPEAEDDGTLTRDDGTITRDSPNPFYMASCVTNEAAACIAYNGDDDIEAECGSNTECLKDELIELCTSNNQCLMKNIAIADYFHFDVCIPKYPKGFDLTRSEEDTDKEINEKEVDEITCGFANQNCIVVEEKKVRDLKFEWIYIANKACTTAKFAKQMNDFCVSLGDCGSYVNYVGGGTDNIIVRNSPESVHWDDYQDNSEPVDREYAPLIGDSINEGIYNNDNLYHEDGNLLAISGGASIVAIHHYFADQCKGLNVECLRDIKKGTFATAAVGAYLGTYVGRFFAKELGISGDGEVLMSTGGSIAGAGLLTMNPITGVIGVGVIGLTKLIGLGETRETIVEFKCLPWTPPSGGDDCEKCNEDSLRPCSKYQCSSLGQSCEIINEDTNNPICTSTTDDGIPPEISFDNSAEEFEVDDSRDDKVELKWFGGECFDESTPVLFSLKTTKYSQCKWDFGREATYEEMENPFEEEEESFKTIHTTEIEMPEIGGEYEKDDETTVYVRCQDSFGNFNPRIYSMTFCIKSGPDLEYARLRSTSPSDGSYLAYGETQTNLDIYLNKKAQCKYDFERNTDYEDMENTMECFVDSHCNTTLTDLTEKENTIYIKCEDQQDIDKKLRNINEDNPFEFTIYSSVAELKIVYVSPQEVITGGGPDLSNGKLLVDLEVKTSGGINNNGVALCKYSLDGGEATTWFSDTDSDEHFSSVFLEGGMYEMKTYCRDEVGNEASSTTNFTLEIDAFAPNVVRVYKKGKYLEIITNEDATCYYDFNNCNFDIDDIDEAIEMDSTGYSTTHSAKLIPGKTYYIKCKDLKENKNTGCAIKVSSSAI